MGGNESKQHNAPSTQHPKQQQKQSSQNAVNAAPIRPEELQIIHQNFAQARVLHHAFHLDLFIFKYSESKESQLQGLSSQFEGAFTGLLQHKGAIPVTSHDFVEIFTKLSKGVPESRFQFFYQVFSSFDPKMALSYDHKDEMNMLQRITKGQSYFLFNFTTFVTNLVVNSGNSKQKNDDSEERREYNYLHRFLFRSLVQNIVIFLENSIGSQSKRESEIIFDFIMKNAHRILYTFDYWLNCCFLNVSLIEGNEKLVSPIPNLHYDIKEVSESNINIAATNNNSGDKNDDGNNDEDEEEEEERFPTIFKKEEMKMKGYFLSLFTPSNIIFPSKHQTMREKRPHTFDHLNGRHQILENWYLLYSNFKDGKSIQRLNECLLGYSGSLFLLIKTTKKQVFGAFISDIWMNEPLLRASKLINNNSSSHSSLHSKPQTPSEFGGNEDYYLFSHQSTKIQLSGDNNDDDKNGDDSMIWIYGTMGVGNNYYMYVNKDGEGKNEVEGGFGFGGQKGHYRLWIKEDGLRFGSKLAFDSTYNRGTLGHPDSNLRIDCDDEDGLDDTKFEIDLLEMWGIGNSECFKDQREYRRREGIFIDRNRKVDRKRMFDATGESAQDNPDMFILRSSGITTSHCQEQG